MTVPGTKTTDLPQISGKLYHIKLYLVLLAMSEWESNSQRYWCKASITYVSVNPTTK
jgi:hypothetical protein